MLSVYFLFVVCPELIRPFEGNRHATDFRPIGTLNRPGESRNYIAIGTLLDKVGHHMPIADQQLVSQVMVQANVSHLASLHQLDSLKSRHDMLVIVTRHWALIIQPNSHMGSL